MNPPIKLGQTVLYTLTEGDEATINTTFTRRNAVKAGMVFPALVVRVWSPSMANLQVLIDGQGTLWATSKGGPSQEPGSWSWLPQDA